MVLDMALLLVGVMVSVWLVLVSDMVLLLVSDMALVLVGEMVLVLVPSAMVSK